MKYLKSHITGRHSSLPKHLVQRSATCIFLFLLLIIALCALTAISVILLVTNIAHAQTALPRHYLMLIDQSGSVMSYSGPRELARQTSQAVLLKLRALDVEQDDTLRIDAFGSQRRSVLPETALISAVIDTDIDQAFVTTTSLGGTLFDQVLTEVLSQTAPLSDIVMITDGWPDAAGGSPGGAGSGNEIDRMAYSNRLRAIATQFAQRGIRVHVILTGNTNRTTWLPTWQAVSDISGGELLEIKSNADLPVIGTQFLPALSVTTTPPLKAIATSTPLPTPADTSTPVPTSAPTSTPSPTPTDSATPMPTPTITPSPTLSPLPLKPIILVVTATPVAMPTDVPPASFVARLQSVAMTIARVGLCGMAFLFVSIVLTASQVAGRRQRRRPAPVPSADEGHLDIYSAELDTTGEMKRVELKTHVTGEVLTLGHGVQFDIDLQDVGQAAPVNAPENDLILTEVIMAALIFTPRGPIIEGRAVALCVDGQVVQQHLLFDGDMVYLDRYAIFYTNFFRRAPADDLRAN